MQTGLNWILSSGKTEIWVSRYKKNTPGITCMNATKSQKKNEAKMKNSDHSASVRDYVDSSLVICCIKSC